MGRKKTTKRKNQLKKNQQQGRKMINFTRFSNRLELFDSYYHQMFSDNEWNFQDLRKFSQVLSFKINTSIPNHANFKKRFDKKYTASNSKDNHHEFDDLIYLRKEEIEKNLFLKNGISSNLLVKEDMSSLCVSHFLDANHNENLLFLGSGSSVTSWNIIQKMKEYRSLESSNYERTDSSSLDNGLLAINELNQRLASILSTRLKVLETSNVIILNHQCQQIPELQISNSLIEDSNTPIYDKKFYFDKVLVNAPCSRDGTKSNYKSWKPENAIKMHYIQLNLLKKAIEMTKINGTIIYTTCSLNPIENEAVIAEIFRKANGASNPCLEIQNIHGAIEGVPFKRGMAKWDLLLESKIENDSHLGKREFHLINETKKGNNIPENEYVLNKNILDFDKDSQPKNKENYFKRFRSLQDYKLGSNTVICNQTIQNSLFCQDEEELISKIGIQKTGRLYPSKANAFPLFIAVIKKKSYIHFDNQFAKQTQSVSQSLVNEIEENYSEEEKEIDQFESKDNSSKPDVTSRFSQINQPKTIRNMNNYNLISVISASESEFLFLKRTFRLSDDFPEELLVKNTFADSDKFSLISYSVLDFLKSNIDLPLRKLFTGTVLFEKRKNDVSKSDDFFPVHSSLPVLCKYLDDGVISVSLKEFCYFIDGPFHIELDELDSFDKSLSSQIRKFQGSVCFICLDKDVGKDMQKEYLSLRVLDDSITLLVSKKQKFTLRLKFGLNSNM
jgi:16S rRNA C967 or C1407 C5-methylase (RsmB/RsmF family)